MNRIRISALAILLVACTTEPDPPVTRESRIASANAFTEHYSRTRLSAWNVRGSAAGADCAVLFVEASMILEDSLVDALHSGTGHYAVYKGGGVHHFSRECHFRGVAYRDSTGYIWTYDAVTPEEARTIRPCH